MCSTKNEEYEVHKMAELDRKVTRIEESLEETNRKLEENLKETNRKLDTLLTRLAPSREQGQE